MRYMKTVYCNEEHVHDVTEQLALLMDKLQEEHPDWGFDMGIDWEPVKADEDNGGDK